MEVKGWAEWKLRPQVDSSTASLAQVGCQLVFQRMLVGLEVKLEVGFQLGAIRTEPAPVQISRHLLPLCLGQGARCRCMPQKHFQAVSAEHLAHQAAKQPLWSSQI